MNPQARRSSLPPKGAARRGSKSACADLDGKQDDCVSRAALALLEATRRRAA